MWLAGRAAVRLAPPSSTPQAAVVVVEERQGRCRSHLIGGAEGRLAELADLPDVFPGHHPSPPETPTYHALAAGVQAQRWRALRFAAGRRDTERGLLVIHLFIYPLNFQAWRLSWHALKPPG